MLQILTTIWKTHKEMIPSFFPSRSHTCSYNHFELLFMKDTMLKFFSQICRSNHFPMLPAITYLLNLFQSKLYQSSIPLASGRKWNLILFFYKETRITKSWNMKGRCKKRAFTISSKSLRHTIWCVHWSAARSWHYHVTLRLKNK